MARVVLDNHAMFRTIRACITLTHPWAVAVVMVATAVFGVLASGDNVPIGRFLLLLGGMLGGQIAIGASNEWIDREADALDKPLRPIPAGHISAQTALLLAGTGLLLMVACGAALGLWGLLVLMAGTACGLLYNVWLKRTPWSWLPYLIALPLVPTWVWLVMDSFQPQLLWLYPLGATFVLAIHLSQTLPDIDADGSRGEHGIGVMVGQQRAGALIWVAAFGSTMAVALGALLVPGNALPALVASTVVALLLLAGMLGGPRFQGQLFKLLTSCAVILATGWIVAVAA